MKLNRPILILILVAASVLAGLCTGILIQKFFPVGRTFQKIKQLAGYDEAPNIDKAFVPVSPPASAEIQRLAQRTSIDPITGAIARNLESLRERLESSLPDEEAFRNSEPVTRILNELGRARKEGKVAKLEYRHDRIFRESNLRSFEEFDSDDEDLETAAKRIAEFASLLEERGTHLIYSPAPNPLDCSLAHLAEAGEYQSARPKHTRFLMELLAREVDVIDLRPEFGRMAMSGDIPYHRFDHHWTPAGIELASEVLHKEIDNRFDLPELFGEAGAPAVSYHWIPIPASRWNLELAPSGTDPGTLFGREVLLGDAPILSVPSSPVWVMGDSMLLEASQTRSGVSADLGSHLSGQLKVPVNTLGRPGTVDIRQAYFINTTLAGSQPKLLIWIHSDEEVSFPEIDPEAITAASESLSGVARILEVSPLPDPKTTPYPDAIFSFRAEMLLPRGQRMTVIIYTWGFRERSLTRLAKVKEGDERTFSLRPWLKTIQSDETLKKARLVDQLDNSAGHPVFWLESGE